MFLPSLVRRMKVIPFSRSTSFISSVDEENRYLRAQCLLQTSDKKVESFYKQFLCVHLQVKDLPFYPHPLFHALLTERLGMALTEPFTIDDDLTLSGRTSLLYHLRKYNYDGYKKQLDMEWREVASIRHILRS